MSKKELFKQISEEKQTEYEVEAIKHWGEDRVKQSNQLYNSYNQQQKELIEKEGVAIYKKLIANMHYGPESREIQTILVQWHQYLQYFYEPSLELLEGLANCYNEHPGFNAYFTAMDPGLPDFLQKSISYYVDELETRWLEREYGILQE
jgi:hypothetical protein